MPEQNNDISSLFWFISTSVGESTVEKGTGNPHNDIKHLVRVVKEVSGSHEEYNTEPATFVHLCTDEI